jgi:hypothetical protein
MNVNIRMGNIYNFWVMHYKTEWLAQIQILDI